MRIRHKLDFESKPQEWLPLAAFIVIIILLIRGDIQEAVSLIGDWLKIIHIK